MKNFIVIAFFVLIVAGCILFALFFLAGGSYA